MRTRGTSNSLHAGALLGLLVLMVLCGVLAMHELSSSAEHTHRGRAMAHSMGHLGAPELARPALHAAAMVAQERPTGRDRQPAPHVYVGVLAGVAGLVALWLLVMARRRSAGHLTGHRPAAEPVAPNPGTSTRPVDPFAPGTPPL